MEKDVERAAIVGLALASLDPGIEAELRRELELEAPPLPESLQLLADLTRDRVRESHRVLSLLLLTKVAARRGPEPLADRAVVDTLGAYSAAVVEEGRRRELRPSDAPRDALGEVEPPAESPARPEPVPPVVEPLPLDTPDEDVVPAALEQIGGLGEHDAYTTFAMSAQVPLGLTEEEANPPKCDDEKPGKVRGKDGIQTLVTWETDRPASDYLDWTDPRDWDLECSLFFEALQPLGALPDSQEQFVGELFLETLKLSSSKKIITPLHFTRRVEDDGSSSLFYWLPQDLSVVPQDRWAPSQLEVDVDHGHLDARAAVTSSPEAPRTNLTAEKWIHFTLPALADWPTLLCDLHWMELCILMSLGCASHD